MRGRWAGIAWSVMGEESNGERANGVYRWGRSRG